MQEVPGLSVGLQAGTAMFDAVAQSNSLRGAAAMDADNAQQADLQGALNITDIHRRGRAVQGEAIAALAGDGMGVESGSSKDLIYQNALEIEYSALNARYSAASEARGYRFKATQEKQAARNAIYGGILRAGAAAIGGIQKADDQRRDDASYGRLNNAYYPGGQRLPVPPGGP